MNKPLSLLLVLLIAGCAGTGTSPEPEGMVRPASSRVLAATDWALTLLKGQPLVTNTTISH